MQLKKIKDMNEYVQLLEGKMKQKINEKCKTNTTLKNRQLYKFLIEENVWNLEDFCSFEPFKTWNKQYEMKNRSLEFHGFSEAFLLECKLVFVTKLLEEGWTLKTVFTEYNYYLNRVNEFLVEMLPNIQTLNEIDIEKNDLKWINWLDKRGIATTKTYKKRINDKKITTKSTHAVFLRNLYELMVEYTDTREEWEKDVWDVRKLSEYGIYFNRSQSNYSVSFEGFENEKFKKLIQKYCKERLIKNDDFTWATMKRTVTFLKEVSNVYFEQTKENDFSKYDRKHFIDFLDFMRKQTAGNQRPEENFNRSISITQTFFSYIQKIQWREAPKKDIRMIIFSSDKMRRKKRSYEAVNHIPNFVLDQLITNLNELPRDVQMVTLIMLHTGLRISDVLELNHHCLLKIKGKYWIETDINKTNVEKHRVPIDEKLANMVAVIIDQSKKETTKENNPSEYIFCNFTGRRKGLPLTQRYISDQLNILAKEKNIVDELGNVWYFKNHSFRHTYAVKLVNSGVNLIVVQDLLAHASPEMTLVYARLVDDTKRKEWEKAYDNGAFRFDDEGKQVKVDLNEMANEEGLKWEWIRHNLDAVKVSHGFCFVSAKQGCKYQVNPCLNANGGKPCKHLAVTPEFAPMYEFDIEMKKKVIEEGKQRGDEYKHWVEKNEKELNRIEEIYNIIKDGQTYFQKKDAICHKGEQSCPLTNKNENN